MKISFNTYALLTLFVTSAWAEAPVIDLNQGSVPDSASSAGNVIVYSSASPAPAAPSTSTASVSINRQSLPMEERVKLLEQQINNSAQLNLSAKIDNLQQQIQELTGQLEVQAHNIQAISELQKNIDQGVKHLGGNDSVSPSQEAESNNPIAQAEAAVTKNSSSEEKDYQKAFNLLANKQNDSAIASFKTFVKNYPKGVYIANAHYWLGELYNTTSKNDLASAEFSTVITQYPNSAKVSDAMLKLAIIQDAAGQHAAAQRRFKQILKQFPGSTAARLAKMQLEHPV